MGDLRTFREPPRPSGPGLLAPGLLLAALLLITWLPLTQNAFVNYDDQLYLTNNRLVRQGLTWPGIQWAFTTTSGGNWHPLTWISHMADCQLFGLQPWGHHLVSALIHSLTAVCLFAVLARMTGTRWRSFFVAALFGLHPLRVESVAWASERKDVLAALFWVLTIWAYVRFTSSRGPDRKASRGWFATTVLLYLAGLLCKATAVTLPFALLMLDYWPLLRIASCQTRGEPAAGSLAARTQPMPLSRAFLEKAPFLLLAMIAASIAWRAQSGEGYTLALHERSLDLRIENAFVSYIAYLGKTFWPLNLSPYYPFADRIPPLLWMCAAVLVLGITVLTLVLRRNHPWLLVGWFWYGITLLPVLGLVQIGDQAMADRYTYIPSFGLFLALVWEANHWRSRLGARTLLVVPASALIVVCAGLTLRQSAYWRNTSALFNHSLAVVGDTYLAHKCLGSDRVAAGHFDQAIPHFQKLIELDPRDAKAHIDLGIALAANGQHESAVQQFRAALALNPRAAAAHANLGTALCQEGAIDEGIREFEQALALDPNDANTHKNLAIALVGKGQTEAAIGHLREALRIAPDFAEAAEGLRALTGRQP